VSAAWDDYHRAVARVGAEMIGSANYFDEHPEFATDERVARTFREYAERLRAVAVPS
jgi:stress response protein YsnF